MPGPRRNARTVKETRFKSKMRRNNTYRAKREATTTIKGEELEVYKNHLIAGFQIQILIQHLKNIGAVVPEVTCETNQLDDQYTLHQVEQIIDNIKEHVTNADELEKVSNASIEQTRTISGPDSRITGKALLMFIMLAWLPLADAKWNEFSAPIDETNMYDTIASTCVVISSAASASIFLNPLTAPIAMPIAAAGTKCSVASYTVGTLHRGYNSYTGKHTADKKEILWRLIKSTNPLLPDSSINQVIRNVARTEGLARTHNFLQNKGKSYFGRNLWSFRFFPKEEVES